MLRIAYKFNLQKFRNPNFNPLFYSTSSSTDVKIHPFTNYLVNSLNFTSEQALLASNKVKSSKFSAHNSNSVVEFFKQHGFDDTHLKKIVSLRPTILSSRVDKTLKPKFKLLHDLGISGSDLITLTSNDPTFLQKYFDPVLIPNLVSNVASLENDYGINIKIISKYIVKRPWFLSRKPEFFKSAVNRVINELEITPDSAMFLYGIDLFTYFSDESLDSKRRIYKSFGWSDDHVRELMRRSPITFMPSEENIRNKLDFFTNTMGYEPEYLVSRSALFTYSLEKRMLPRYRVLQVLKERDLLDYNFYTAVIKTESSFVKLLINPYREVVPGLLELYQNSKGSSDVDSLSR